MMGDDPPGEVVVVHEYLSWGNTQLTVTYCYMSYEHLHSHAISLLEIDYVTTRMCFTIHFQMI